MILTREKRLDISKRLAALCIIAVHDQGIDHDCCDKIIEHTAEIAYSIGGVNMMNLVQKLEYGTRRKLPSLTKNTIAVNTMMPSNSTGTI